MTSNPASSTQLTTSILVSFQAAFCKTKYFSLLVFQEKPHPFDGFFNWLEVTFK